MFPNSPTTVDRYFDLAEHLALRAPLLVFLLLALYRLIEREWNRKDTPHNAVERRAASDCNAGADSRGNNNAGTG